MPATTLYIDPEQLCVGLYVHLDLSWWEHDFAFSHFRIKDDAQLRALRALGLKRIRYEPARSDCEPLPRCLLPYRNRHRPTLPNRPARPEPPS